MVKKFIIKLLDGSEVQGVKRTEVSEPFNGTSKALFRLALVVSCIFIGFVCGTGYLWTSLPVYRFFDSGQMAIFVFLITTDLALVISAVCVEEYATKGWIEEVMA